MTKVKELTEFPLQAEISQIIFSREQQPTNFATQYDNRGTPSPQRILTSIFLFVYDVILQWHWNLGGKSADQNNPVAGQYRSGVP